MKTRYVLSCLLLGSTLSVSAQKTAVKSNLLSAANGALNAGVEYAFGLVFNRRHQIWDYRRMPGNVRGQICLPFTLAWCGLSALALGGMRLLPHSSRERISAI